MRIAFSLGLAMLAACTTIQPTSTAVPAPTSAPSVPTVEPTGAPARRSLTLWLPPQFAPDPSTPSGLLLADRLAAFDEAHPELEVAVRVKSRDGPGSLDDALAAAGSAASASLPDVVVLDQRGLRRAVAGGYAAPLQGLLDPADWYGFAEQAARIDDRYYAFPFGGDVEAFAYRLEAYPDTTLSWDSLVTDVAMFAIPAGDPESHFTLAQYLALGGTLSNANGQPALQVGPLDQALGFLVASMSAGALSASSVDYESSAESWLSLANGRVQAAQAPFDEFLTEYDPQQHLAGPLPTRDGRGTALAGAWSWAITSPEDPETAAALIQWLNEPAFVAAWTHSLGLLPARPEALSGWPDTREAAVASRIVPVTALLPERSTLDVVGPALRQAVDGVLTGGQSALQAAREAVAAVEED